MFSYQVNVKKLIQKVINLMQKSWLNINCSLYNSSTFFCFLVFWDFHLWKKTFWGEVHMTPPISDMANRMAPFSPKSDQVRASSCENKIAHTKNWKILKNLSIFIFSSDHPKNFESTIEFNHTPPKSTSANRLALVSPILDDAIKRYSQNKTKKSQNHFFLVGEWNIFWLQHCTATNSAPIDAEWLK